MSEQTTDSPELKKSTPEQAEALYNWAVAAATKRGTQHGALLSFKAPVDQMPEAVARYITPTTSAAERVVRGVYANRTRDYQTGEYPTEGFLLDVVFDETEWQADSTQIN